MNKARWVIDTNVLVSAMLFEGSIPGQATFHVLDKARLLSSADSLGETIEVVNRKKFDKYVTSDERAVFLSKLIRSVVLVEPSEKIEVCKV